MKKLCTEAEYYGVVLEETKSGATLIDAGIQAKGGFLAGQIITEICLGGYGKANILHKSLNVGFWFGKQIIFLCLRLIDRR